MCEVCHQAMQADDRWWVEGTEFGVRDVHGYALSWRDVVYASGWLVGRDRNWDFHPVQAEQVSDSSYVIQLAPRGPQGTGWLCGLCWSTSCACGYVFEHVRDAKRREGTGRLVCGACTEAMLLPPPSLPPSPPGETDSQEGNVSDSVSESVSDSLSDSEVSANTFYSPTLPDARSPGASTTGYNSEGGSDSGAQTEGNGNSSGSDHTQYHLPWHPTVPVTAYPWVECPICGWSVRQWHGPADRSMLCPNHGWMLGNISM